LGFERENLEAAKTKTQADKMNAMNEVSNIALAKMSQEANILMADMSGMVLRRGV
jgi:hypothetical protein